MNDGKFDINQELEQMRQEYAGLKEQFDKQQILNDRLMQKAMGRDVRRLFFSKKSIPFGVALNIAAIVLCFVLGYEWWMPLSLIIFGLIFFPGVFWAYKDVREDEIYNGDILSTTETLLKFKKKYIALEAGISIYFFAFVIAATLNMTTMNISTEMMWRRGIIVAVLCIGTLALEYIYARRVLKSCDGIIQRLQLKEDEPQIK